MQKRKHLPEDLKPFGRILGMSEDAARAWVATQEIRDQPLYLRVLGVANTADLCCHRLNVRCEDGIVVKLVGIY